MKVIVGLGNPGSEYEKTRHNVGFMVVDKFAEQHEIELWKNKFDALIAECYIGEEKVLVVKPLTFMNLSGKAVGQIMNWYKLNVEDLIVIHDDMDIPAGTARLRMKGGSGGHNGIKSILENVGSEDFARMRVGIGRPLPGWSVVDHVLAKFPDDDKQLVDEIIVKLVPALDCFVKNGIQLAMNRYNFKPKKQKKTVAKQSEEQSVAASTEGDAQ